METRATLGMACYCLFGFLWFFFILPYRKKCSEQTLQELSDNVKKKNITTECIPE